MVVLRCTRKLLTRLRQAEPFPAVESTTRLGDWYGNTLRVGASQYLLFISERARLPVVIAAREAKRLGTVFPDAVCEVLAAVGIAPADIEDERTRMSQVTFGKTRNRSILGTMNDFALMTQYAHGRGTERDTPEELVRFLARTPILPLKGARPIELTREAFEVHSAG